MIVAFYPLVSLAVISVLGESLFAALFENKDIYLAATVRAVEQTCQRIKIALLVSGFVLHAND